VGAPDRVCDLATTAAPEEVRHIHRGRRPVLSAVTGLGVLVSAVALQLCLFGNALVALVLMLVAAGQLAAYANGAPIHGPEGHQRIAGAGRAGGHLRVRPPTLRWVTILGRRETPRCTRYEVGYLDGPGGPQVLRLGRSAATRAHQVDRDRRAREIVIATRAAAESVAATWVTPITGPGQQSSGVSTNERTSARIDFKVPNFARYLGGLKWPQPFVRQPLTLRFVGAYTEPR